MMSMSASSPVASSSAPDFVGILRNRLEALPHKVIAAETKIDASHLGKALLGTAALKLSDVARLMALAQLKAVDSTRVCVRAEEIALLRRVYALVNDQAPWLLNMEEQ